MGPARRIPGGKALPSGLTIFGDSRERYPFEFAATQVSTERRALPAGDYAVMVDDQILAAVERKSLENLAKDLVEGSLPYQLAELASVPHAAVVVEDRYSRLFKLEHVRAGWVAELLARVQVRYPSVPIVFCETRPLAEQWTYQFLVAVVRSSPELPA